MEQDLDLKQYCEQRKYQTTPERVEACKQFIEKFYKPGKNINEMADTYKLKHYVENWCGFYVGQEDFIQAALELGYRASRKQGTKHHIRCNLRLKEEQKGWDAHRMFFDNLLHDRIS